MNTEQLSSNEHKFEILPISSGKIVLSVSPEGEFTWADDADAILSDESQWNFKRGMRHILLALRAALSQPEQQQDWKPEVADLRLMQAVLDWNRAQTEPPIKIAREYDVANYIISLCRLDAADQKEQPPASAQAMKDERIWSYRRYGSEPEKGYTIIAKKHEWSSHGEPVSYLGDGYIVGAAVEKICNAHNQTVLSSNVQPSVNAEVRSPRTGQLPRNVEQRIKEESDPEYAKRMDEARKLLHADQAVVMEVRRQALEEAAKLVDHIYKEGGGTYGDAIRSLIDQPVRGK